MKTILTLFSSILIMALFTQCGSAQFDKNPPFTINKAYYQDWVGGRPGSNGTIVTIEFSDIPTKDVTFDSIFLGRKIMKAEHTISDNKNMLSANFVVTSEADKNIIMHSDPSKEFGNQAPEKLEKTPFELSDNECVISYMVKDKKHYFKIENLLKEKTIYYP